MLQSKSSRKIGMNGRHCQMGVVGVLGNTVSIVGNRALLVVRIALLRSFIPHSDWMDLPGDWKRVKREY